MNFEVSNFPILISDINVVVIGAQQEKVGLVTGAVLQGPILQQFDVILSECCLLLCVVKLTGTLSKQERNGTTLHHSSLISAPGERAFCYAFVLKSPN